MRFRSGRWIVAWIIFPCNFHPRPAAAQLRTTALPTSDLVSAARHISASLDGIIRTAALRIPLP